MPTAPLTTPTISPEFVAQLAERAQDAERRRQLPAATIDDLINPLQRIKRDVDVICGHVVFDSDTSSELAAALTLGMKVSRTAMV